MSITAYVTRSGYNLLGWSTDPTGNSEYSNTQSGTGLGNMSLYAVWILQ